VRFRVITAAYIYSWCAFDEPSIISMLLLVLLPNISFSSLSSFYSFLLSPFTATRCPLTLIVSSCPHFSLIHLLPPHFPPKAVPRTHVAKELLTSMDAHKDAATLSNLMSAALRQPMRGHNQVCESTQGWMMLLTHCVWGIGLGVELRMPERTWVVELALSERENIYWVVLRVF